MMSKLRFFVFVLDQMISQRASGQFLQEGKEVSLDGMKVLMNERVLGALARQPVLRDPV